MKKKIVSLVALAAMCTILITGCAEKHMAPPTPPTPPGAPAPPTPPAPPSK